MRKYFSDGSKKNKIFIVDDSPDIREILAEFLLSIQEFEISFAQDGDEAITKTRQNSNEVNLFDLIFLDWHMPKLDGIETLRILRQNKNLNHCWIIMLSAEFNPESISKAKELKADFFISKPFDIRKIKLLVEQYTSIKQSIKA